MVHLSPGMRAAEPYPFEELDRRRAEKVAVGRSLVDLGAGDPRDETAPLIRDALKDAVTPVSSYPRAAGLPELREAIVAWVGRRFGVTLDPDTNVLPTLGSKEPIFSLAQALLDPEARKHLVTVTTPGYTVPERGTRYAGGDVARLTLIEPNAFLPDLDAVDSSTWDRTAAFWINYPNNPTGAVAPLDFLRRAADRCREHDAVLASDEAYCELWFEGEPPASALQVGDLTNVLAFHTLSKRSSMTGYRSGFVAGDPELIAALRKLRPSTGLTPQEFVQRASVAAWNDEAHVEEMRAGYARKRKLFLDLLAAHRVRVTPSPATFYLWVAVPEGTTSLDWSLRLLDEADVIVAPGSFFGEGGEGYVRLAMVPTLDECERAAEALDGVLGSGS
jgi:N-succinyldiaminopimelate aminotransferase